MILAVAALINGCTVSARHTERKQESTVLGGQETEVREARREEIPFMYDSKVFSRVELKINPKAVAVEGLPVESPTHSCFYLEDKRALPAFDKGARYFYPAYSFICTIPLTDVSVVDFAKAYPYISEAAIKLRKLLKAHPSKFKSSENINDLPFNNAGGVIQSRVQYLAFKTGRGVLFLTQYSQEMLPNPINNEELTCNFQGLTNNGKYYIAARLACSHPSLPRGIDFTNQIERDEKWHYLRKDEQKLNGLTEESFQPSLKMLKFLISSISVE